MTGPGTRLAVLLLLLLGLAGALLAKNVGGGAPPKTITIEVPTPWGRRLLWFGRDDLNFGVEKGVTMPAPPAEEELP